MRAQGLWTTIVDNRIAAISAVLVIASLLLLLQMAGACQRGPVERADVVDQEFSHREVRESLVIKTGAFTSSIATVTAFGTSRTVTYEE